MPPSLSCACNRQSIRCMQCECWAPLLPSIDGTPPPYLVLTSLSCRKHPPGCFRLHPRRLLSSPLAFATLEEQPGSPFQTCGVGWSLHCCSECSGDVAGRWSHDALAWASLGCMLRHNEFYDLGCRRPTTSTIDPSCGSLGNVCVRIGGENRRREDRTPPC